MEDSTLDLMVCSTIAGSMCGVSPQGLLRNGTVREPRRFLGRNIALYLARVHLGLQQNNLSEATGIHRDTIMRAIRKIEEQRETLPFDRLMDIAEEGVETALGLMSRDDVRRAA